MNFLLVLVSLMRIKKRIDIEWEKPPYQWSLSNQCNAENDFYKTILLLLFLFK